MLKTISETAFEYNGQLIDVNVMAYDARKCNGRVIILSAKLLLF